MESHFLTEYVDGESGFQPEPWYNRDGDCVIYQAANEAVVADRIDDILTIYRSANDHRPVGFQIKDVKVLVSNFGLEGLQWVESGNPCSLVSVAILLLAAYETGPQTVARRKAYAGAMESPKKPLRIPQRDLAPA